MSFIDNILDKMGLSDDYYDDEFYDDEEEFEEETPKRSSKKASKEKKEDLYDDEFEDDYEEKKSYAKGHTVKPSKKVTNINDRPSKKRSNDTQEDMEVCVIKPTTVEDAREITETLLNGRTVVLNLEGLDIDIAQRIIDFTSGSCFAISGNLQKISSYIFIITPQNVDIFGDFQDILNGTINVSAFRRDY